MWAPQHFGLMGGRPSRSYDAATTAWVAAVISAGGTVSTPRKGVVDDLIVGLKTDGVWTKLDRLWPFAAENAASALTDLVADASASAVSSPTFTTDRGYAGNGSSAYIDSNFNAVTASSPNFTQNSSCFFAWNNTSGTDGGALAGLATTSLQAAATRIFPEYTDTNMYWDLNITNGSSVSWDGRTGLYLLNRSASNAQLVEVNGSSANSNAAVSGALESINFSALLGSGGSNYSSRQVSCLGFGASLSSGERTALYNRLRTYMTAVGVP